MQVYHDGELVKTVTTSLSGDSKVTSIKGSGDHNPGATCFSSITLAVYDSVLNGNDFAYLDTHGMPLSIPEPATATLGLLGLTALLVRRQNVPELGFSESLKEPFLISVERLF